jgi:hypothetical protein
MDLSPVVVGVGMAAVFVGGLLKALTSPEEKNRRRLVGTPRTLTSQLRPGLARVTGRAKRASRLLQTPISHRPCVAFEAWVGIPTGDAWHKIFTARELVPFVLVDEAGEVPIEPDGHCELILEGDLRGGTDWVEVPVEEHLARAVALLTAANAREGRSPRRKPAVHYYEAALEEGDLVSVYGTAIEDVRPDGHQQGPRSLPTAMVMKGTARELLRIGDGPLGTDGLGLPSRK